MCGCWSLFGVGSSVSTVLWKFTFICLFPLFAPLVFFFATLSFSPSSRVLVLPLPPLSCLAPPSLTTTSSLSPSMPPLPLGTLQPALDVVQILCCHGDTVKLLQQGVQGGEEPPQRGFGLRSLPPADTSHHHPRTEPQTQAQPESQPDPRRFCQAAGARGGRAP